MADKNRFTDLVGGLNQSDKPAAEPEQKTKKRAEPISRNKRRKAGDPTYQKTYEQSIKRGHDGSIGKSADPNYDKVTVYIKSEVAHALRVVAAVEKLEMSQIVEDAVLGAVMKSAIGKATLEQSDN